MPSPVLKRFIGTLTLPAIKDCPNRNKYAYQLWLDSTETGLLVEFEKRKCKKAESLFSRASEWFILLTVGASDSLSKDWIQIDKKIDSSKNKQHWDVTKSVYKSVNIFWKDMILLVQIHSLYFFWSPSYQVLIVILTLEKSDKVRFQCCLKLGTNVDFPNLVSKLVHLTRNWSSYVLIIRRNLLMPSCDSNEWFIRWAGQSCFAQNLLRIFSHSKMIVKKTTRKESFKLYISYDSHSSNLWQTNTIIAIAIWRATVVRMLNLNIKWWKTK